MPPPPPLEVGHKVWSNKGYVLCVSSRFAPTFGLKIGGNLSEDLFFFILLFTWFWAKNRTDFGWNNFWFRSLFFSNFLPPPLFKILRTLLEVVNLYCSYVTCYSNCMMKGSGADLCWALGGIICNFTPILPYFQHWGDEPRPRFCSGVEI